MNSYVQNMLKNSLAGRALASIAILVALVIAAMTTFAYFHVASSVKTEALNNLENYIVERAQHERQIFQLAEENHAVLKNELLRRLNDLGESDPIGAFEKKVERLPDGTLRTRLAGFDGTHQSFVYIGQNVEVNADLRRRVMTFIELCEEYGAAWHHRLQNVYFTTPENFFVGYWPEVPDWAHSLPADLVFSEEEYVWVADKKHDPSRESVWTGLFYDIGSNVWMVSLETPVDVGGKQIATIGHDITLNELLEHTVGNRLEGTYNLIVRNDGRLIVHPEKMQEIKDKKGYYDISESNDVHLKSIYNALKNKSAEQSVVENAEFDEYLAVGNLEEPGWYFVTVYPRALITASAFDAAIIVLLMGITSLILELIIFYVVLVRSVAKPLNEFTQAVNAVAVGDLNTRLDVRRNDEIGMLGMTFNRMTESIRQHNDQLSFNSEISNAMERALSSYVSDIDAVQNMFSKMLEDILRITDSEYGFIGEIQQKAGVPFLKTHAITDISWDDETRMIYQEYAEKGMEFHNLDTLFGAAIRENDIIISNDPKNDPRSGGLPHGHPALNAFLGVPLMIDGKLVGLVGVANCPQGYSQTSINNFMPLVQTCANVINSFQKNSKSNLTEAALSSSQNRLQLITSRIPGVVYQFKVDMNGQRSLPYVSVKIEEYIGLSAETVMNDVDEWFSLTHPDDLQSLEASIADSMNYLTTWNWKGRFIRPDGLVRWLRGTSIPVRHKDGSTLWDGVFIDITDRHKVDEALKKSERHLERAQAISGIGHWELNLSTGEVTGSAELLHIFDLSRDEVILAKFIEIIHPDDKDRNIPFIQRGVEHGEGWDLEHRIICKDGTVKWIRTIGEVNVNNAGNVDTLLSVVQDTTERKTRSLELQDFKNILDQTLDCVFIFEEGSLKFTYVNEGAVQQTGYTREELFGMRPYDIKPDISEMEFQMLIAPLLSGCEQLISFETVHLHKSGLRIPVEISVQYIISDDGKSSFVAIVRDITERAQMDNELESYRGVLERLVDERTLKLSEARDEAERSNLAKSEFLSHMSHELRTPLNAILGFGQMLELDEEGFTNVQQQNVQEILESGRHLLTLINDVLDLSRIESGKFEITMEEVRVDDLLSQCISMIQPQAIARNLEILDHITGKNYHVRADSTRLKQVLVNLLSNSVKYNRKHGVVTLDSKIIDNQYLRFLVTDCGDGLSKDDIAKLFSPFVRLNQKDNVEGAGIGLIICTHLIDLMGGNIGVDSTPGVGSTFWVDVELVSEGHTAK